MEMIPQLLAIAGVLGALYLAVWALKRKGWVRISRPTSSLERQLEVVDRLVLTPHHSLHLVRMADRTLLIGLSPNGCNLLESSSIHPSTSAGSGR
jgi:flagellar biosynthetic protein FliO